MQPKPAGAQLAPAVMVHFYRGAMDVSATWRARIDSTTNWAIISSGSIASFLFSDPDHSHIMTLLGMFLVFAFLWIEARRFRFYALWSTWIRVMETEYFGSILGTNTVAPDRSWHGILETDLEHPRFKMTWAESMGQRIVNNYWAIFGFLLLTWCTKLLLHPTSEYEGGVLHTMRVRASLGPIDGWFVVALVVAFYIYLGLLTTLSSRRTSSGVEILNRDVVLKELIKPHVGVIRFRMNRALQHDDFLGSASVPPEED
ncbi:MAG: hypothetical protein NVS4B8_03090 [Herpetosiphon sp.]